MNRKVQRYIAILLVMSAVLAGCSKKENTNPSEKTERSGVITLQMRQCESFNPLNTENHSVRDAFSLCYEPLFIAGEKMKLEGVLARSITVADDAMSAIVMLKDSVVWHDGVRFTSADVLHTVKLLQENPSWEYASCVKNIESIEPIDPLSFKINLSRPYGQIGYSLYFPIVASHNQNLETDMLGTGAYRFEKYNPATLIEMKSFDKWHGGKAACENVNISIIRDDAAATTAFNSGMVNAITGESFDLYNVVPKSNARMTTYPSNKYEFMAFNHKRGVFSSASVRCAVSAAIDRSDIVQECYGGSASATNAPLHPKANEIAASSILSQYSLSNAAELLFLEGYTMDEKTRVLKNKNGVKLSFDILVNEENQIRIKCAQLLQKQLMSAGIEVSVTCLPFEEYTKEISAGRFDAYLGGTRLANLYDFEFLLADGASMNSYGYLGEYMNLALSALAAAPSEDALSDAVFNFEEVFLREQPVCGLAFCSDTLITAENIMGKLQPRMNFPYANMAGWSVKKF